MMERMNKYRQAIVLGILVLFLIWFVFYMFAVRPANKRVSGQLAEISQLNQEQTLFGNKITELQNAGSAASSEEDASLASIPQGDNSENLINDLKTIGDNSNTRLKDIGFSLTNANDIGSWTGLQAALTAELKEIKMSAIVEGSYADIHDWFKQLNALPRLISVDSFAFQQPYEPQNAQNTGSILTAKISFTAYYEAEPSDAQPTASK